MWIRRQKPAAKYHTELQNKRWAEIGSHSDGLGLSLSLHDQLQAAGDKIKTGRFFVVIVWLTSERDKTNLRFIAHRWASASFSSRNFSASAGILTLASSSFSLRMISCSCRVICCVRSTTWTCIFSSSMRCLVLATWNGNADHTQLTINKKIIRYYLQWGLMLLVWT